jgi:hypothetical protein
MYETDDRSHHWREDGARLHSANSLIDEILDLNAVLSPKTNICY